MALTSDLNGTGLSATQARMLGETVSDAITAAGITQGTATLLTSSINCVTTVAVGANGVRLKPIISIESALTMVRNSDTADALNVYPASGEFINEGLVDIPVVILAGTAKVFFKVSATKWIST